MLLRVLILGQYTLAAVGRKRALLHVAPCIGTFTYITYGSLAIHISSQQQKGESGSGVFR